MAPRSQPYRLRWPLSPYQLNGIDEMFQLLFDDIGNDSVFPVTTEGDMMYRDDERVVRLPIGEANTVLRTDGTIPEWDKVDLTADVVDTLPVASGGTGATSFTPFAVVLGGTTATGPLQDVGAVGTSGQVLTSNGASMKPSWQDAAAAAGSSSNYIINGGFAHANRQASGTLTTYSNTAARVYTADRWAITNENASVQYQRINAISAPESGLDAPFYGRYLKITNAGKVCASQVMIASRSVDLRGHEAQVQLKLKASTSMTLRVALLELQAAGTADSVPGHTLGSPSGTFISAFNANSTDPTFGTNLAKITPDSATNATIANDGLTCSVTTSWQQFGGVFTIPSDSENLILVIFSDSDMATNSSFYASEVGLFKGTGLRDWVEPHISDNLNQCLHFYRKTFPIAVAPAQNTGLDGAILGWVSVAGATAGQLMHDNWDVQCRIRPDDATTVFYNPAAANAFVRNVTAGSNATATAVSTASGNSITISFTGIAAWTVAQTVAVHYTIDMEI